MRNLEPEKGELPSGNEPYKYSVEKHVQYERREKVNL